MTYEMKPLACDPARLRGLSEKLIVSHDENNYGGAAKRLKSITAQLAELSYRDAPGFVINGLKREELIAANSILLHEVYFASLARDEAPGENVTTPLLALDMYEHSYHIDYGAKAAAYVDAFMQNIAWSALERRLAALPVGIG